MFRVTVKPVVGDVTGASTGLKLLVGYDMLVIQRPHSPKAQVTATHDGGRMTLHNSGNTNAELFRDRQCPPTGGSCEDLPGERLYAGTSATITIKASWQVRNAVKVMDRGDERAF